MSPSQMMLRGAFYIFLPKTANLNHGRFPGNIDNDDHWIGGGFCCCQNDPEQVPFRTEDTYGSCSSSRGDNSCSF